jgi:hypothetical protein
VLASDHDCAHLTLVSLQERHLLYDTYPPHLNAKITDVALFDVGISWPTEVVDGLTGYMMIEMSRE